MAKNSKLTDRKVSLENLGAWVFKCNPKDFDIAAWIAEGNDWVTSWTTADNYRSEFLLAVGQPAILWVSGPTKGAKVLPGIWGIGFVTGSAYLVERVTKAEVKKNRYQINIEKGQEAGYEVPLDVEILSKPLDRKILKQDPILKNAEVFRQPQGSNPSFLTKEEYAALRRLIKKWPPTPETPTTSISVGNSGGKVKRTTASWEEEKNKAEEIAERRIEKIYKDRPTEREALVKSRVGQGFYRLQLSQIEKKCRVTGIKELKFLVASHIKPWRVSTDKEKLDGNNGFFFAAHIDHLFDRGWISFQDNGKIKISSQLPPSILKSFKISPILTIGALKASQKRYLKYHRTNIFDSKRTHGPGSIGSI